MKREIARTNKTKGVQPRSQNLIGGEVLGRHDRVGGVVERGPDDGAVSEEGEVTRVVEGGGGDAFVGGARVPDGITGAVEKAEGAGWEELEGGRGVHWGGACCPDGDAAGVGYGGDEGGGAVGGDGAEA